jgi:hypothetical protein
MSVTTPQLKKRRRPDPPGIGPPLSHDQTFLNYRKGGDILLAISVAQVLQPWQVGQAGAQCGHAGTGQQTFTGTWVQITLGTHRVTV